MKINAIVTGATGMTRRAVLLECLENPAVASVLVVARSSTGVQHEKLLGLTI